MANSPLVIRFFATFAEISFTSLVAIPLLHLNKNLPLKSSFAKSKVGSFFINRGPIILIICILIAQIFAYTGLFTQYLILFAVEETLWGLE